MTSRNRRLAVCTCLVLAGTLAGSLSSLDAQEPAPRPADFDDAYRAFGDFMASATLPWTMFTSCPLARARIRAGDQCAREGGGFIARRGNDRRHLALDLESTVASNAPVSSIGKGVVKLKAHWPNLGHLVLVEHPDGFYSLYGHLASIDVEQGAEVAAGTPLGTVGYSGNAACLSSRGLPAHVHFAVYKGFAGEAQIPGRIHRWLAYREEMIARFDQAGGFGPLDATAWLRTKGCIP